MGEGEGEEMVMGSGEEEKWRRKYRFEDRGRDGKQQARSLGRWDQM